MLRFTGLGCCLWGGLFFLGLVWVMLRFRLGLGWFGVYWGFGLFGWGVVVWSWLGVCLFVYMGWLLCFCLFFSLFCLCFVVVCVCGFCWLVSSLLFIFFASLWCCAGPSLCFRCFPVCLLFCGLLVFVGVCLFLCFEVLCVGALVGFLVPRLLVLFWLCLLLFVSVRVAVVFVGLVYLLAFSRFVGWIGVVRVCVGLSLVVSFGLVFVLCFLFVGFVFAFVCWFLFLGVGVWGVVCLLFSSWLLAVYFALFLVAWFVFWFISFGLCVVCVFVFSVCFRFDWLVVWVVVFGLCCVWCGYRSFFVVCLLLCWLWVFGCSPLCRFSGFSALCCLVLLFGYLFLFELCLFCFVFALSVCWVVALLFVLVLLSLFCFRLLGLFGFGVVFICCVYFEVGLCSGLFLFGLLGLFRLVVCVYCCFMRFLFFVLCLFTLFLFFLGGLLFVGFVVCTLARVLGLWSCLGFVVWFCLGVWVFVCCFVWGNLGVIWG